MNIIGELFGEIPNGWNIVRLSSYFKNEKNSIKAGPFGSQLTNTDMQGSDIKVYNQRTVLDRDFQNGEYYISADKFEELKGFIVEPKDILVTTRGTIGKCIIVPNEIELGILHPCLIKMKINELKINLNYLEYIFNGTNIVKEQVQFLSNSTTIDVIYTQTLKDLKIVLPQNISIQNKIVAYLDRKVAEIDLLISKKEIKLNLLEQQRQSIITEAVTKGLNPNVKMKDSGIEWIGEVPEHWEVNLLKRFLSKITDGSHFSPEIVDEGLPYVTVKDLKNGYIDTINALKISEEDYQALIKNGCKPNVNDVLLSKDGTIGKVALVKESNFVVLSSLAILTPSHNVAPRYLEYWLNSLLNKEQMESYLAGAALRRITLQTIGKLNMILPPMNEQKEIVVYLDKKLKPVTDVINKVKQEINLIKEYRQSLIYEAVTGKIDLRELELD